ncbi:transcription initiation factor IIB [Haloarcula laminariae]|uniref:transcription initiation factor IIB n=1 Tax=Haloarcula laminariae TaxID=2961577 RepID=UPI00240550D9|nr:transcription initiation factor IIB family protein [Halomicroarcula sp. FL173]
MESTNQSLYANGTCTDASVSLGAADLEDAESETVTDRQSSVATDYSETANGGFGSDVTADAFDTTAACSECGAAEFERSSTGEWYCSDCGLLHSGSAVEYSEPGWRPVEQRRTAPATGPSRIGIGTVIGNGDDSTPRWAQYNTRLDHDQETLRHGLKELRALGAALEASDSVVNEAAVLFRRARDEGLLVGHSLEAMAAACIHAVARERRRPFPTKAVAAVSPVECDSIRSAYSKLVRAFNLKISPPTPSAFIPRFAAAVGLSQNICTRARHITESLTEDGAHVGQSPTGVAAAALYGAATEAGVDVTQSQLAEVAHVSVVTLSRQWQTVQAHIEYEQ